VGGGGIQNNGSILIIMDRIISENPAQGGSGTNGNKGESRCFYQPCALFQAHCVEDARQNGLRKSPSMPASR